MFLQTSKTNILCTRNNCELCEFIKSNLQNVNIFFHNFSWLLSTRDISSVLKNFFETIIDDFPQEQKINYDYKTMRRKYLVIWYNTKYPMGDGHYEIHFISYKYYRPSHNVENFEF